MIYCEIHAWPVCGPINATPLTPPVVLHAASRVYHLTSVLFQQANTAVCTLKDQVPDFEASVEVSQLSLTNLQNLFGRFQHTSSLNLVQREFIRQSEFEMAALAREISSVLHRLIASDTDNSFHDLYLEDNDALDTLVDVLSALTPGVLSSNNHHPTSRASLSELASLLEGVSSPNWFPHPNHQYLPHAVPPQETTSDVSDAAGSVDTDTALAELANLDEDLAHLEAPNTDLYFFLQTCISPLLYPLGT
ncbi:hypothetical protein BDZ97DRAFT_1927558 [Flammula alnicola]|nr:hypothetical protein BDZ97DRAFT_1927558 [Flammula alnicola]